MRLPLLALLAGLAGLLVAVVADVVGACIPGVAVVVACEVGFAAAMAAAAASKAGCDVPTEWWGECSDCGGPKDWRYCAYAF